MTEFDTQLSADATTLRDIVGGLECLELELDAARKASGARQRGYFSPDEDDRARCMLLAYRNYRLSLYEIIGRYAEYPSIDDPKRQLTGFLIGFAAGLTLYSRSLMLIRLYGRDPLARQKFNEADEKFGLAVSATAAPRKAPTSGAS